MPRLHPLRVQMSRSPRCHKVQGHTANPSQGRAYSQDSGSRPGAPRPPPRDMTEPERPHRWRMPPTLTPLGPGRYDAARTEPQLLSGVTGDPHRPLPVPGGTAANPRELHSREEQVVSRPTPLCPSQFLLLSPNSPHLRRAGQEPVGLLECPSAPRETHGVPDH